MIVGTILYIIGNILIVLFPIFPVFIISICIILLGSYLFIPSLQAYLGDRVSYENRARAIGIIELGWSLSFIIGMPIVGFIVSRFGWLSPFKASIYMGLLGLAIIFIVVPAEIQRKNNDSNGSNYKKVLKSKPAMTALLVGLTFTMANELVALFFGVWLEDSFSLKITALGAASMLIGFSEVGGESLTAIIVDKLGKTRSICIGLILNGCFALLLPVLGNSVAGALIGLFFFFLTFEFSMVSYLPLMTEVLPNARATFLGIGIAVMSIGRAVGASVAPLLYGWGFQANTFGTIILNILAIYFLSRIKLAVDEVRK